MEKEGCFPHTPFFEESRFYPQDVRLFLYNKTDLASVWPPNPFFVFYNGSTHDAPASGSRNASRAAPLRTA